nr:HNH endonuclease signature motif containing protein [Salinivibrio kushneri]
MKEFPESGNVNLGERAHIIPHSKDGPRGDGTSEGGNTYDNLILLCGHHHAEVDGAWKDYSRNKLLEIKIKHEQYIRNSIDQYQRDTTLSKVLALLQLEGEPRLVPALMVEGGSYQYFSRVIPRFAQKIFGGSFGHWRIGLDIKNIGSVKVSRVVLKLWPKWETMPKNVTFSTDIPMTRSLTPLSYEKEIVCGPFNVGELKSEPCIFYLNYKEENTGDTPRSKISAIEFEYYRTCDDATPTRGMLKIANP